MPLIRDESLAASADDLHETFEVAHQALPARLTDGGLESARAGFGLDAMPAGTELPAEVAAAQEEFQGLWSAEHGSEVDLQIVQYFRHINNEFVEGWSGDEGPGANPVQISQTIAISGAAGAYVDVRQWIARAEPRQ